MQLEDKSQRPNKLRSTKHSITVGKRSISISLEEPFWEAFKEIARQKRLTHAKLLERIIATHGPGNMSSAVRVFVLAHFRAQAAEAGKIIG